MSPTPRADIDHASQLFVTSALRLREGERFVVVADEASAALAVSLDDAATSLGAQVTVVRIDRLRSIASQQSGERPHQALPDAVRRAMLAAQASAFVASAPRAELAMREQLLQVVAACGVRHAHMAGTTDAAFTRGLRVDYERVAGAGRAMGARLEGARVVRAESRTGTDVRIGFAAGAPWVARVGAISPGKWASFPTGALYASPEDVDGVFVADASLGESFGAREGRLRSPVRFHVARGRVVRVEAEAALQREVEATLAFAANSDRVGLAAIGVNAGVDAPTGDAVIDQLHPSLHLFFGDPAGRATGATWSARTSFAACATRGSVFADGQPLVDDGHLAASL